MFRKSTDAPARRKQAQPGEERDACGVGNRRGDVIWTVTGRGWTPERASYDGGGGDDDDIAKRNTDNWMFLDVKQYERTMLYRSATRLCRNVPRSCSCGLLPRPEAELGARHARG
jgi:hypothetical protein